MVDLFDWIETGLVWLADGAAWRRLLIKIWVWAGAERCQSNNTPALCVCVRMHGIGATGSRRWLDKGQREAGSRYSFEPCRF